MFSAKTEKRSSIWTALFWSNSCCSNDSSKPRPQISNFLSLPRLFRGAEQCHVRINDTALRLDRKSTRLNSSHGSISYAVFCLKKKNKYLHKYNHLTSHEF